ncbi:hypothetical protein DFJ73DRAFT_855523 [Zopfochytrium polystomum]|nr:hypothetical protein DFJ73DRAFT_855523 [Zopfochytrium polystomum]
MLRLYTEERWASFSLQKQLLIVFSVCVAASLLAAEIVALVFLIAFGQNLTATSSRTLRSLLASNVANGVVTNAALLLETNINRVVYSGLTILSIAAGDAFRSDYSTSTEASYFDSPSTIDQPTFISPTASKHPNKSISLTHSSWMLPTVQYGDPTPTLTSGSAEAAARDATAHTDAFTRNIYFENPRRPLGLHRPRRDGPLPPLSGHRRHAQPDLGHLRPSAASVYTDPNSDFFVQQLKLGIVATPSLYIVTDPYLDFSGRGWCITAARIFEDATPTGQKLGVAGMDWILSDLAVPIRKLAATTPGSWVGIFLTDASGTAVAHSEWDLSSVAVQTQKGSFTVSNTTQPRVTADLWANIRSSGFDIASDKDAFGSADYTDPDAPNSSYLIVWKTISTLNGKNETTNPGPTWVAVGAFPQSNIQQPVTALQNNQRSALGIAVGISLGVFAVVTAIVLGMVAWISAAAVKPLNKLSTETTTIANNIGTGDLFAGVGRTDSLSREQGGLRHRLNRIDEAEALTTRFYAMVQAIREGASASSSSSTSSQLNGAGGPPHPGAAATRPSGNNEQTADNVFFNNAGMPRWNAAAQDRGAVELLPDEPPSYAVLSRGGGAGGGAGTGGGTGSATGEETPSVYGPLPSPMSSVVVGSATSRDAFLTSSS